MKLNLNLPENFDDQIRRTLYGSDSLAEGMKIMERNVQEAVESRWKEEQRKERRDTCRFWITTGIAGIAIGIAIVALILQYRQGQQIQEIRLIRDTVQQPVISDSPKTAKKVVDAFSHSVDTVNTNTRLDKK